MMTMMRGNSRGRKEEENTTIEGGRSGEGTKDATQQPTNGGAQLEAEALAERRRQANGQHDNQRSSGGQRCGCVRVQRRQLRCGGSQSGNTTSHLLRGGLMLKNIIERVDLAYSCHKFVSFPSASGILPDN